MVFCLGFLFLSVLSPSMSSTSHTANVTTAPSPTPTHTPKGIVMISCNEVLPVATNYMNDYSGIMDEDEV